MIPTREYNLLERLILSTLPVRTTMRPRDLFYKVIEKSPVTIHKYVDEATVRETVWILIGEGLVLLTDDRKLQRRHGIDQSVYSLTA